MNDSPGGLVTDVLIFVVEHWEGVKTCAPFALAALFIVVGVTWLYKVRKEGWDEERCRLRLGATVCLIVGALLVCVGTVLFSL